MAVLVTRPLPDGETTAASLRARGFAALVGADAAVRTARRFMTKRICTMAASSSPAPMRCAASSLSSRAAPCSKLPLFAVGEHSAAAARQAGFAKVDHRQRRRRHAARSRGRERKVENAQEGQPAALSRRRRSGARSCRRTRRERVFGGDPHHLQDGSGKSLPREVCDAFVAGEIEAVLHYSRRSARAFLDAARDGGVEISALALPQCCISAGVAAIVREAGASQVAVAASPDENALFEALDACFAGLDRA